MGTSVYHAGGWMGCEAVRVGDVAWRTQEDPLLPLSHLGLQEARSRSDSAGECDLSGPWGR